MPPAVSFKVSMKRSPCRRGSGRFFQGADNNFLSGRLVGLAPVLERPKIFPELTLCATGRRFPLASPERFVPAQEI